MDDTINQLCNSLNLDKQTADDVQREFTKISEQFMVEGEKNHWLACAIYAITNSNLNQTNNNIVKTDSTAAATTSPTDTIGDNNKTPKSTTAAAVAAQPSSSSVVANNNNSGNSTATSAGVSLTQLLRQCKLSLVDFLSLMEKWLKMSEQSADIRPRLAHLERNFNVSAVVFKKYKAIFPNVFKPIGSTSSSTSNINNNDNSQQQQQQAAAAVSTSNRTRKSTANAAAARQQASNNYEITSADIYYFCWVLYINIKATRPAIGEDLVNSYHLLLACIDFCYSNALVSKFAHDVLNPNFKGLPDNFHSDDFKIIMNNPAEQPVCILQVLCNSWDGIAVDAKGIREHWLKPYIRDLAQKKILQLNNYNTTAAAAATNNSNNNDPPTLYLGVFDASTFEISMNKLTKEHDLTMLTAGDFDERIFLSENAHKELGAPVYDLSDLKRMISERDNTNSATTILGAGGPSSTSPSSTTTPPNSATSSAELDKQKPSLENGGRFVPQTPLSNRNYLVNKVAQPSSPVANATRKVGDLYRMLAECTGEPTTSLEDIFKLCTHNPREIIMERTSKMVQKFVDAYTSDQDGDQPQAIDLARKRGDLARKLYFKVLEQIIVREQNRLPTDKIGDSLSSILSHDIFHISLFACCVEIVLASHSAKRTFPWILDVYKNFHETQPLFAFSFYKVIELVIREEERLSRDIVKHLATIEERVLDSMAWEADSPLWTAIAAHGSIPTCQDVVLPPTSSNDHQNPFETSPLSALRRHHEVFQSPMSLSGRYSMAAAASHLESAGARRRLFDGGPSGDNNSSSSASTISSATTNTATTTTPNSQIFQVVVPHRAENGDIRYAILNATSALVADNNNHHHHHHGGLTFATQRQTQEAHLEPTPALIRPAVRANPVNLFFRKVYYLAQLRFRDLWNRLSIRELSSDSRDDLQRKIWTLFEDQIRNHTNLLRDRHLDQMIMCSTYAVLKVCKSDPGSTFFKEIIKAYRFQPQANIDVYRSVLLSKPPLRLLDDSGPPPPPPPTSTISTRASPNRRAIQSPIRNGATSGGSASGGASGATGSGQSSLAGATVGSHHQTVRERGDLVEFYNQVFVPNMKGAIVRFAKQSVSLSPLPRMNTNPISPWRRVSQQHSVYVSPLKCNSTPASPGRQLSYNFHRSPAKDLQIINNMVNRKRDACKRILQDDDGENTKRPCYSDVEMKRINDIMNDRRSSR